LITISAVAVRIVGQTFLSVRFHNLASDRQECLSYSALI